MCNALGGFEIENFLNNECASRKRIEIEIFLNDALGGFEIEIFLNDALGGFEIEIFFE